MSLNNIVLDPQLLCGLYPDTLVENSTIAVPEPQPVKYLGKNLRKIIIMVNYESVPFLPDEQLNFLTSILSACKLSLADIAVLNCNRKEPDQIAGELDQLEAKQVITFGLTPLEIGLPINFPHFQIQEFNKCTYLYSPSLSEISEDKAVKQKLWQCLKTMFSL